MPISLSPNQALIERSIYHAIRRRAIAEGFTPDVSLFSLATEQGQQDYRAALVTIAQTKGFAIEVFGVSNAQQKGVKDVARIVIVPGNFLPGEVGYAPTTIFQPNNTGGFDQFQLPIESSDYHVDIYLVSNTAEQNRILNSILASALYRKGYIPVYPLSELQPSGNLFYYNTVNIPADNPSQGLIEKIYSFIFHDINIYPEVTLNSVAALQELVVDLYLPDIIAEDGYIVIEIPDYIPPDPPPPSCGNIPNLTWEQIQGCLNEAQLMDAITAICSPGGDGDVQLDVNGVSFALITAPDTFELLVLQGGSPVGSKVGDNWVVPECDPCADGTVNVQKSDSTLISAEVVASGGTVDYPVADSVIRLEDTAAVLISNTNVKATDPATIVAPDGTVNNSDVSFTQPVVSNGIYVLDDYDFELQEPDGTIISNTIKPAMNNELFIVSGLCPTEFSYNLNVNGVFQEVVTVSINDDININVN